MAKQKPIDESLWVCSGCAIPTPNRIRKCECPTACLFQHKSSARATKVEDVEKAFNEAVKFMQNFKVIRGKREYVFELMQDSTELLKALIDAKHVKLVGAERP